MGGGVARAVWRVDVRGQAHGLGHLVPRSDTHTHTRAVSTANKRNKNTLTPAFLFSDATKSFLLIIADYFLNSSFF